MNDTRRRFLKTLALGAGALSLHRPVRGDGPQRKPNIIFILADDLGYGDLGCYGQKQIRTPNLDKMAAEGMRFTQHYSGSTVCAPSRATLMLGFHTGHLRTSSQGQKFQPEDVTVAKLLKQAGYVTGCIGKWGLGQEGSPGIPTKQGFDYYVGYLSQVHAHNYYPEWLWRNEEKVKLRNVVTRPNKGYAKSLGGAATERVDYSHDLFTKEALGFLERNKEKPFFLYLPYTIPHANNESRVLKRHGMEIPDYGIYKDKDWPDAQKGHAAMISRLDRDVGALLAKLKELGIDDNTLVLFSSDNGPHKEGGANPDFFDSNGPLRGIKRDLYEGGVRLPLIARWPGKIKPGTTSDHISAFWDFLPTACNVAGIEPPKGIDGISYLPTLLGRTQPEHEYLYWEYGSRGGGKRAVRMGDWKLVELTSRKKGTPPTRRIELYSLKDDLGETKNLADQHPDIVKKMTALLRAAKAPPKG